VGDVLPSGKCVLEWRSRMRTLTVFESLDQVSRIHGHGGRSAIRLGVPPDTRGRDPLRRGTAGALGIILDEDWTDLEPLQLGASQGLA